MYEQIHRRIVRQYGHETVRSRHARRGTVGVPTPPIDDAGDGRHAGAQHDRGGQDAVTVLNRAGQPGLLTAAQMKEALGEEPDLIVPWLPNPRDPVGRVPYVHNIYTLPEHRRRGLGRRIMEVIIAHCREMGFALVKLHASSEGRPLYESLGFTVNNEMRLNL